MPVRSILHYPHPLLKKLCRPVQRIAYADNETGAVSATGWGEPILRVVLSKAACDLMGGGLGPGASCSRALGVMRRRADGVGGACPAACGGGARSARVVAPRAPRGVGVPFSQVEAGGRRAGQITPAWRRKIALSMSLKVMSLGGKCRPISPSASAP